MRTKQELRKEIRVLMTEYAKLGGTIRVEINAGRKMRLEELLMARHEILLSICHRQGMMIQAMDAEIEFNSERKVA